jgi:hypothetical protein
LIFSDRCNEKEYIRREVTVAGDAGKVIIPFRIEDVRSGLRMRLSDLHWIDAFVSFDDAIDELIRTLQPGQVQGSGRDQAAGRPQRSALLPRTKLLAGLSWLLQSLQ